ncbi:MAG: SpaA isopeptide-forming pilin-related protein, partial [Enterococcus sp.]
TGNNSSSNGNASQQGIVKNIDGAIDYTNREVPWKIDINNAGYWMENWELEDTFSKGLYLVSDSFQIIDKSDNNRVLNKSEYTLKETATGFQVSFNKPLKDGTDHKFQIKYKTKFDTSAIDGGTGSENDTKFVNKATMTWVDNNGGTHTNHTERPFLPIPEFKYNGSKSGEYNATTKKIQWSVTANYNQQALKNATITDPIQTGQNYVSGSGKLYEAAVNKDGSYTLGNEVANAAITEPSGSTNRVTVKLPEGSKKAYVFVFETSLEGEIIDKKTYDNTATFKNNGINHDLDASVTVAHAGELITKDGTQNSDDSNYVNWHVTINSQQATLKNVVVTDEPSANQYVTASDVKVYGTTVSKDGTITEDKNTILKEGTDYNLVIQTDTQTGKQTIEVHFLNEISRPYMIDYRALITSDKSNDVATNSAHLTGENDKVIHGDIEVDVPIVNHDGSATGSKGSVQIQKEDTEGKKLEGAHFQLWTIKDGKKSVLVREGDTDSSGTLKIGNLRVQKYLLIETKAPDGYTISDELASGKVITITNDSEESSYPVLKVINEPSKVLLHKLGETVINGKTSQNPLAGAEFKVTNRSGKTIKGYEKIVSDKDGLVTIEKLLPGDYYLVETKAPNNYIVETQKIAFTVTKEDDGEIPTIELNDLVNYQGSAELVKKDAEGKVLAGAEFKVVDAKGKEVQSGLVSDDKGVVKVTNLAPGNYQFIETKAPSGYVLNSTPDDFTIKASNEGKPEVVEASANFVNYQGSAELVKKDANGKVLAGAEFKVVDAKGKEVQSGLVSDDKGVVKVTNLAPGKYQFVETKAPEGYVQNSTPVDFTIKASNEGKPEVVEASANFVNYQGSAELVKKDANGKVLAGAEFKVVDAKGKEVQKGLVSTDKGVVKVENLAPGKYQFIETKAPEGYVLNSTPVDFTIKASKPEVVEASANFVNYQGSAELVKKDADGKVLAGAEFKVVDATGKAVQSNLVSTNKDVVKVENLAPGNYQFVETKAPSGYVLNSTPVDFTIKASNEGKPKVVLAGDFVNKRIPKEYSKKPHTPKENNSKGNNSTKQQTATKDYTNQSSLRDKKQSEQGQLPKTNDQVNYWMTAIGIILVGSVLYLGYQRRKKTK